MKKTLFTLIFAIPFLGFSQTLTNKNFDTNTSGWNKGAGGTSSVISWDATEGATAPGSLKFVAAQANARAQTTPDALPTNGAGDYTLTFKVKGPAGKIVRGDVLNNGASITGTAQQITLTGGWDTFTKTYTLNNTNTNIRLLMVDPDTASPFSTYYFDDVTWTWTPPAGNTILNLASNNAALGTTTATPFQYSYLPTDVVSVSATPKTHAVFSGWSGDLTGTTTPANVTMSTNKNITANFSVDPTFNYAYYFNTGGDLEGWSNTTDTNLTVSQSGGLVTLTPTANQFARFSLTGFPIPAASYNKLTIKMKNTSATTDQLGIVVNNGVQSVTSSVITTSDADFVTYNIYLNPAVYTSWTGTVTDLRLRFADADNATSGRPSDASPIIIDDIILSYDATLSTGDISKAKNLLQVVVADNTLHFRNATVNKATIYSMTGQIAKEAKVSNNQTDVSSLKSGVYMVKAVAQDGSVTITKFFKK